jgi:UDP-2-acetamido-3-amino-2,3-dideoxy-glucuronate N-acetyltransferase
MTEPGVDTKSQTPAPYVHPAGICESGTVGCGTTIWAFAHVLPGAVIGEDCNICDHVFVENDVRIGDRTTVKCGVQLWDGVLVGSDVFIGPNATFTNDPIPRSKRHLSQPVRTLIEDGASIGANATILPGLRIHKNAIVGAGAVVTSDVPPNALVSGNPARITGYIDPSTGRRLVTDRLGTPSGPEAESGHRAIDVGVGGATFHLLPVFEDLRGTLSVSNVPKDVPFSPARCFIVYGVPSKDVRGEHAHRTCTQFLVCSHGACSVVVDDGTRSKELLLDSPERALLVPPLVWVVQYKFTPDASLVVLASEPYRSDEYIRDYDEFREIVAAP